MVRLTLFIESFRKSLSLFGIMDYIISNNDDEIPFYLVFASLVGNDSIAFIHLWITGIINI